MARLQALLILLALCKQATTELNPAAHNGTKSKRQHDKLEQDHFELEHLVCQETPYGWERTCVANIAKGVKSLLDTPGLPSNRAGVINCSRVSCRTNAAIWWCNHASEAKTIESFALIARGARLILGDCPRTTSGQHQYIYGQAFNVGNWSVIVRQDNCEPLE